MPNNCIIIGCKNREGRNGVKMYRIPTVRMNKGKIVEDLTRRRQQQWLKAINRKHVTENTISNSHRVCSSHFSSGNPANFINEKHPDWVPHLHLNCSYVKSHHVKLTKRKQKKAELAAASTLLDLSSHRLPVPNQAAATTQEPLLYRYFNARARGELPRLVAAATGLKIINSIVEGEEWNKSDLKSKAPYQQLPCLVVGDKWYADKLAISFYLAEIGNKDFVGQTPLERLELNQCVFYTEDLLESIVRALLDRDFLEKGTESLDSLKRDIFPEKLKNIEKYLQDKGTGYFVGKRMTIADLSAFDVFEHVVDLEGKEYLDQYPCIKESFERTSNLPAIREHVSNGRSKTPMCSW